ncbi:MAG: hypothetical protein V3T31_11725, partial [candidate division Zixibacteria bacterium]
MRTWRIVYGMTAIILAMMATDVGGQLLPPVNIRITNIPELNNEEQLMISPVDSNIIIADWRDFRLGYR